MNFGRLIMLITDEGEAARQILHQIVDSNTLLKLPLKLYIGRKDRLHVLAAFSDILLRLSDADMVLVPDDETGALFLASVLSIIKFSCDARCTVGMTLEGNIAAFISNLLKGSGSSAPLKKVLDDGHDVCLSLRTFLSHTVPPSRSQKMNSEREEQFCELVSAGKVCRLLRCLLEFNPELATVKSSWMGDNLVVDLVRLFERQTYELANRGGRSPTKRELEGDVLQASNQCVLLCSIMGILSAICPSHPADFDTDSSLAKCLALLVQGLHGEGRGFNNLLIDAMGIELLLKEAVGLQRLTHWDETRHALATLEKNLVESGLESAADHSLAVEALRAEINQMRIAALEAQRLAEIEKVELLKQAEGFKKQAAAAVQELGILQARIVDMQQSHQQLVKALDGADLMRMSLEQTCADQASILEEKDKEIATLTAGRLQEPSIVALKGESAAATDTAIGPRELPGHSNTVNSVSYSPDGALLASGSDDHTIRIWFLASATCKMVLQGHDNTVYSVAFSPDGMKLASGSYDKTVRIWCLSSRVCLNLLEGHGDYVLTVAYNPNGSTLVSGSLDGFIYVWSASSSNSYKMHEGKCSSGVYSVAYSPDGISFASGSYDKTISIWSTTSLGLNQRVLRGHTRQILSVAFSPDGTLLVSGSWDNTVRVWSASSGDCIKVLQGHSKAVMAVTVSNNGMLASGSRDNSVRIWSTLSGECVKVMEGHKSFVLSVAFSCDGKYLASGSSDHSIFVWEV